MKKVKILLVILVLSLLAWVSYITYPQTDTEAVQSTPTQKTITVSELHELVNIERSKAGIAPLTLDERLNQSALLKAQDMYQDDYFSHVDPVTGAPGTGYIPRGIGCRGGENLSAFYNTSEEVVNGWMGSTAHRDAMLSAQSTRVGYAIAGEYIVQHLC